jgi:transposase InsO family protein
LARKPPRIPLPEDWPGHVRTGILHVVSLAQVALTDARARAKKRGVVARLRAKVEEQAEGISLLKEELDLKDLRMSRMKPRRRPHYRGVERLRILELKAARGWSKAQAAERLFLRPATIAEWTKRADEEGEGALLQTPEPINRFPDFVCHIVILLKVLCPTMGKKRIAQTLARAGLVLGVSTVGRMLKERDTQRPEPDQASGGEATVGEAHKRQPVKAKEPNHVWQVDLTLVPTAAGFWVPWLPHSILQLWPFSWWVACVVDHYSRRVMGFAVFKKEPKSVDVRTFLGRIVKCYGAPKYIISDKGRQFDCSRYRSWCDRKGIDPRYAAAESIRATAVIERFFLSLKTEWLRRILVPLDRDAMQLEVSLYLEWFARRRPHQGLDGRVPQEVYDGVPVVAREKPEAKKIPRSELIVRFHEGRRQLPMADTETGGSPLQGGKGMRSLVATRWILAVLALPFISTLPALASPQLGCCKYTCGYQKPHLP